MRKLGLLILCLALVASVALVGCAPEEGVTPPPPEKEPFKVGITAAMTGYAAITYLAGAEGMRCYFEDLNAEGGIDGRKVEFIIRDNRGEPPRAVSQAKEFIERGANLIIAHGPSATYSGVFAEAGKSNIPVIIGGSGTPKELPPEPLPLVFDATYSCLYDCPALMARTFRGYEKGAIKLGLLGMDIPVSHLACELYTKALEKEGIEVLTGFIPAGTVDVSPVASKFKAQGCSHCFYYGPGGVSYILYSALTKLGWEGTLYTGFFEPIEQVLETSESLKTKILYFGLVAPFQLGYPEHEEMLSILKKYKAAEINSMTLFGYPVGPEVELIFTRTGYPATTEKLLEVMNNFEIDFAPIYGKRIWTKTDHTGTMTGRLYICDENGKVSIASNWFRADSMGKKIEDLGPELK